MLGPQTLNPEPPKPPKPKTLQITSTLNPKVQSVGAFFMQRAGWLTGLGTSDLKHPCVRMGRLIDAPEKGRGQGS